MKINFKKITSKINKPSLVFFLWLVIFIPNSYPENNNKYKRNRIALDLNQQRNFCLKARDFQGCMRSFKPGNSSNVEGGKDELDFLGLPKLDSKKWMTIENKPMNHILYLSRKARKIKVRGMYGRYITYQRVSRMYREPVPGTPTQINSDGLTYTSCDNFGASSFNTFDFGTSISCTSYGPTITTIPGTPSIPGGIKQNNDEIIIDCLDRTYQAIDKKGRKDKWRVIEKDQMKFYFVVNCGKINLLEPTNIRVYERGTPNEKDNRAKNSLPGKVFKRW